MLLCPPLLTDRVPSLAAQSSIQLLIKRCNQCLNLSNNNNRRECRKQNTTMLILLILLGGDVQMNPGPNKYPCGICDRPVAKNHRGLECDECGHWVHIKCGNVTSKNYELLLLKEQFTWICPRCAIPNFSDCFFDESNLADVNLFDSLSDLETSMETTSENVDQPRTSSPKSKNHETQRATPKTKSKLKKGKLKFMTINCDGLKRKQRQQYLASLIDSEQPDIIMGQESKLDNSYTDAEVFPDGYLVKRKDRNARGGGVFIAYRDNLVVNEVRGSGKNCELVVLKVEVWKSTPIHIACYYRQPNRETEPLQSLQSDLEKIFNRSAVPKLILCGDFNLHSIDWQSYSIDESPQYGYPVNELMLDIAENFHFEQKVTKPTRLNNIFDLVFTTIPDCVSDISNIPGMSDHEAVTGSCELNLQTNKKQPRTVHMYRKANTEGIEEELNQFSEEFMASFEERTCSANWDEFKNSLQKAMEHHIPTKLLSCRWNLPWMNDDIKRLMKKRRRRYDAWKKYGDKADLADYKKLQGEVQAALKQAHNDYIDDMFEQDSEETSNPAKKLWRYVKSLKIDKIGIPPLLFQNVLVSKPQQKAEALSEQYKSIFTEEDQSNMPSKGPSNFSTMPGIEISTNGVEKLLNALNPKKAVGPDQVSTRMLKNFASILAPVLKEIFTQSLQTGDVPMDWKTANITAIFKKGERSDPGNYRPVSLTSVTCKMMEHILASNIRQHLDDNNILSKTQHGFRKKHSCKTQLLTTVEDLASSLDAREQVDCLILDFSKAFDSVPHQRLLHKIEWYGIGGNTHRWIENWLTSRVQNVVVDGERSKEADVISGVPQGTVLGPLLFIL